MTGQYACGRQFDVFFEDIENGETCEIDFRKNPWAAEFGYRLNFYSSAALVAETAECCPDCVPIEGRHDLVFVDRVDGFEAWRGPIDFVNSTSTQLIVQAHDPTYFAWTNRRFYNRIERVNIDSGAVLGEVLAHADLSGDLVGLEYDIRPTGVLTDITAPLSSPLSDQMALQTMSADYTYIGGGRVLVGDVSSSNVDVELTGAHWQNGSPEVSGSLDSLASEVVVHSPSFDIVAVFPENVDPGEAKARYGRVLTKHVEVNGLASVNQAAAIAKFEWRKLQVGLSLTTGGEATIAQNFPVPRSELVPGLTVAAGNLNSCIDVSDAAIRLTQVQYELESGAEVSVKVGIEPARIV